MSKKITDDLGSLSKVQLSEEDTAALREKVKLMLSENIRGKSQIDRLLKTDKTFDNSLGNIYLYLVDSKTCDTLCPKKLLACPKERVGYSFEPYYDKDRDEILLDTYPCPYQAEKEATLHRLYPCDVKKEKIYHDYNSLLSLLREKENLSKMKDLAYLFVQANKIASSFSSEKTYAGKALYSINSENLAQDSLDVIAYIFAKSGKRVSYIDMEKLFSSFNDRDYTTRDLAEQDLERIKDVPVLLMARFDSYPRYLTTEFTESHLAPLLKARSEKGKITYLSLTSDKEPSSLVGRWLKNSRLIREAQQEAEELFPLYTIKDFDLR